MGMTVSGMNSNSMNTLFSGFGGGSGFSSMSFVSDYNSIKSGAYGKLLSSYYNQSGVSSPSASANSAKPVDHTSRGYREQYLKAQEQKLNSTDKKASYLDKTNTEKAKSNQAIATSSDNLVKSLDNLASKDTFKTNSKGEYDTESILSAVKSYASAYNSTVEGAKGSKVSGVSSNVTSLQNTTKTFEKSLSQVGITIGDDGKMSVDENKFKASDMSSVKSLFDKGSYGYSARTSAYMTNYYAKQAQSNVTTYGASGASSLSDIMSSYSSYI